jgi:hypothetical protein
MSRRLHRRTSARRGATRPTGQRPRSIYRTILLLIFAVVVIAIIALALIKKSSDVEINLKVSQVSFAVKDQRAARLFNSIDTNFITLSRFEKLTLDRGKLEFTDQTNSQTGEPTGWRSVGIAEALPKNIIPNQPFSNLTLDSVTLNWMEITPGARATLSWSEDEPNSLKVSFDKAASGEVAAGKTFQFSCTECKVDGSPESYESRSLYFRLTSEGGEGQVVRFQGRTDSTVIALDLTPNTRPKEQSIAIQDELNLTRREENRSISTIIEGNIKIEDVGEEIKLNEGTIVELGDLHDAVIKTVGIEKGVNLSLHARAGKLLTGTEGDLKDRLPSLLEWMSARKKWTLGFVVASGIISGILSLLKWLQNPKGSYRL